MPEETERPSGAVDGKNRHASLVSRAPRQRGDESPISQLVVGRDDLSRVRSIVDAPWRKEKKRGSSICAASLHVCGCSSECVDPVSNLSFPHGESNS